jgi:hypothetical protein
MKKILLGLAMIAVLAIPSMGAQLLCGGNVPLINNMVGVGAVTLDFSGPGDLVDIASFIVNNNSPDFDVTWTFLNTGAFFAGTRSIAMTAVTAQRADLNGSVWGLGTSDAVGGLNAAYTAVDLEPSVCGPTNTYTWGVAGQSNATVNYKIAMKASWADASTMLAGLYLEQITFNIVAGGL